MPVPDVEGTPPPVVISTEPDNEGAKKWFIVTLSIAGVMAVAGIVVFAAYVFISNTPGYMLSAAFQNLIRSDGQAGSITYQTQGRTIRGDFLAYNSPSDPHSSSFTLSAGQDASRVSSTVRLFGDGSYVQTAGLGNLGRLITALGGNPHLSQDSLVRLSGLDGRWYTVTKEDIRDTKAILPQHTAQAGPTSGDIETIEQLYLKHPFVTVKQHYGDERIDNINSIHLLITIDAAKLQDFLTAVKDARVQSLTLSDDDIQTLLKSNLLADVSIETWIARSDRTFEQFRLTKGGEVLTITLKSEAAAAQRQTVSRPEGAQSATNAIRELHDILSTKQSAQ